MKKTKKNYYQFPANGLVAVHVADILKHWLPIQLKLKIISRIVFRRNLIESRADSQRKKLTALRALSDGIKFGQLRKIILKFSEQGLDGRVVVVVGHVDTGFRCLKKHTFFKIVMFF